MAGYATDRAGRASAYRVLAVAALLCSGSLALYWPGIPLYDSVAQYGQALSGQYDDWHPPAMARLWGALHAAVGGGAAPMLVVQITLYWLGFGLVAAALARSGRRGAAALVLVVGVWPPFLGWQAAVLKDAQMTGALLAVSGLVGWWRLRRRPLPGAVVAGIVVLLAYATLVRANAVFAVVPFAVMLALEWRPAARLAGAVTGIVVVLAVAGPVNHDLMRAHHSGVERTEAIYDLAGIAVRAPGAQVPIDPTSVRLLIQRRCVKPFFWDPLGEPDRCNAVVDPLRAIAIGRLYAMLATAALAHPVAYAGHRLAHLNSTDRWLVAAHWPGAAPPQGGQPNDLGLAGPRPAAVAMQQLGGMLAEAPLAWPAAWIAVALATIAVTVRRPTAPARDLSMALAVSALSLEASFAVLSIASDLRYHLWSMIAAALAALLLTGGARGPCERRTLAIGAAGVAAVIVAGLTARWALPVPPASYAGMLAW